jgi:hypothetical protein
MKNSPPGGSFVTGIAGWMRSDDIEHVIVKGVPDIQSVRVSTLRKKDNM